tara:strand:- start:333 stop:4823 length:4491 start_codon:yes stop_codon:yes gene_type:complete
MYFLISPMAKIKKTIQNSLGGKPQVQDLFDSGKALMDSNENDAIHAFLELGHLPAVNRTIADANKVDEWFAVIHELILQSNFNVAALMKQRVERYRNKPLFQSIVENEITAHTYENVWETVQSIGSYFCTQLNEDKTVGIFTSNHLNGVLIDLACLTYGVRVVPIPLNLSADHLDYVLDHAEITHLFMGSNQARELLTEAKRSTSSLNAVQIDEDNQWNDFLSTCSQSKIIHPKSKNIQSLASVMYTSGTTDNPKGIIFTQENIITKRFARALALTEVGPDDSFLCYLPLYHTFGRWFEMAGSIFCGSTYTFTESTSFKILLRDFIIAKPSIFISIPKRWIQIQEQVAASIPIEKSEDAEIAAVTQTITGGRLKWGLSAAGYLDPDIFRFFHQNNINLLSGYGMTEATGGITMTPPNDYVAESVGKTLPGIELRLGKDHELLMRGPYVSSGYYKDEIENSRTDDWFHSGDIFKEKRGHYFIVDRKKEIYKNSRGQTISPQKIENLFQDFEAIRSVFLVGDGKEFNTILLYPEPENDALDLVTMSTEETRTYFSSLVFSVNTFLPSYERIVNYAIIPRDFDHDHDELTPKNTYKRKKILKHFSDVIDPMYEKNYISLIHGDYEVKIPNWLLREKSLTRGDIRWDGKQIREYELTVGLSLKWTKKSLRIGHYHYHTNETTVSLEKLLRDPTMWIGNQALVDFIGDVGFRIVAFEPYRGFTVDHASLPFQSNAHSITDAPPYHEGEPNTTSLHQAAHNLFESDAQHIRVALDYLHSAINSPTHQLVIQDQLLRLAHHPDPSIWVRALEMLMPHINGDMFINLYRHTKDLDAMSAFDPSFIEAHHLESMIRLLTDFRHSKKMKKAEVRLGKALIHLITELGLKHPTHLVRIRGELTLWMLVSKNNTLSQLARANRAILNDGFRTWISEKFDPTFDWSHLIQFDHNVSKSLQEIIEKAIRESTLIQESVFIFSKGMRIQLTDIASEGVWLTLLGSGHGKYVVRTLVQLKNKQAYNFVINVNDDLNASRFKRETNWLISIGASVAKDKLVEDFGSVWEEYDVFTEEYIPGETVSQYLNRNQDEIASGAYPDRWQMRWLHFIWNAVAAYIEFWKRSGQTRMIEDASPRNVIIPEFDYYTGTRLVSIAGRKKADSISDVLTALYQQFILETEAQLPGLKKMAEWEILFTVVLEIFGTDEGSRLLKTIKSSQNEMGLKQSRVQSFLNDVSEFGLLRKLVVFASLRYQRWLDLNPEATHKAKGIIIQDLYKDYKLQQMIVRYPETRIRFFLMTAFRDANQDLVIRLKALMNQMRSESISEEQLEKHLHHIHDEVELTESEKYFLTRLVFEHVDAADYAELISRDIGEKGRLDLVVLVEDSSGQTFKIRPPFHPKEVARFHRILLDAKLDVQFETHHAFLLLLDNKDHIAGGVFWKKTGPAIAHLEKVVIAPHYQKSNLSIRVVEELFKRLRLKKYKFLTVGFFQSGLFYKLGFEIDQKFGGLVKKL